MTRLLDSLGTVTEDLDRLAPHPSFIWPETRVLAGNARYAENPPAKTVLADADLISGLIVGAADHTVAWLEDLIRSQRKRRICLVLVLFPAGPTREEHLSQIVTLAEKGLVSGQTLEVRLLPLADRRPGRHTKRAPRSDSLSASQALAALGWERLSSRKLPASPKSRIIIESFPLSAWGSLGLKPLPAKAKTRPTDLQNGLKRLCGLVRLDVSSPPNHDELQAIVSGLAKLALQRDVSEGCRVAGLPPIFENGIWREGYIVNPTPALCRALTAET